MSPVGQRHQRPGRARGGGRRQKPDPAPRIREEGRTKEKIVLHSQEKVKPLQLLLLLDTIFSSPTIFQWIGCGLSPPNSNSSLPCDLGDPWPRLGSLPHSPLCVFSNTC